MKNRIEYTEARDMLLDLVKPLCSQQLPLSSAIGMVLACELTAAENVPPFDRSPYDGYAFRAADTAAATADNPVELEIIEEVPAGAVPTKPVTHGTAVKILTGAPIPQGADAVIRFEDTEYTQNSVKLFAPVKSGDNIVKTGEDVRAGQLLAEAGTVIDAGLAGTLASQGVSEPWVYKRPEIALISTGNEIVEAGTPLLPGKIYNSNRFTMQAAISKAGCTVNYLGIAGDSPEPIAERITDGLSRCDAVILTGGVSVGDYDLTPAAMELAGVQILVRGVSMKPGMACAYGVKDGKLVCGLSGNPAAAITNLYAVLMPALKKLCGIKNPLPQELELTLMEGFGKKSGGTRLLRGKLDLSGGTVKMHISQDQGNVVISSLIGCDVIAVIPAGSGRLEPGTQLKGFVI